MGTMSLDEAVLKYGNGGNKPQADSIGQEILNGIGPIIYLLVLFIMAYLFFKYLLPSIVRYAGYLCRIFMKSFKNN